MFSIVLVTYNSAEVVGDAIRSIASGHQVIVVDNASVDDSADVARALGAEVLALTENLGFGTGCNRGAAIARFEKLLFLNPDARLRPDTLDRLADAFERYPDAAAFNPRLVDAVGKQFFSKRNRFVSREHWLDEPPQQDADIPMGVGAALAVRTNVFRKLGGFDENIFLYFEDVDLSARIINAGYTIRHIHDAIATHLEGKSSGTDQNTSAFKEYHYAKAQFYTNRKHGLSRSRWLKLVHGAFRYASALPGGNAKKLALARARLKGLWDA
ncbi:MAG: glycosyltransferase family 2 protein [Mesorhizobium sp.]|nr:glycosyltransferase family 2 protein [Mesorhizobium sp.]MBL8577060.1 glycosyltransferase family 2 protein [Mesorhizobium sp.]